MAKNVRLGLTENERIAQNISNQGMGFSMSNDIKKIKEREESTKFNNQVDAFIDRYEKHRDDIEKSGEVLADTIDRIEIKPMMSRILIKPFAHNPFQKVKIENGIITDLGGMAPTFTDPKTGMIKEEEQYILTGSVIEVGPDVKYLKEGDVVFYQKPSVVPIPFFKQGLITINENQVFAVVNEGLEARFKEINGK